MKVDAAILIGDRGGSLPIRGKNKNFLEINGLPLFFYVLQALENSRQVNQIFVLGDQDRIRKTIDKNIRFLNSPEKVTIVEQGSNLFENAFIAFEKALEFEGDSVRIINPNIEEKAILYLPGDTPLITSQEIDEFIEKCALERFDYFLGMSTEESLKPFYPTKRERGIKMAYFYLKEKKYRHNNLHLIRPLKIRNRYYVQKMYDYRYQKEFVNFLKLLWIFYRTNIRMRGVYYYLMLHWNLFISRLGLERLTHLSRQLISMENIERTVGDLLGCRFTIVETKLTGAALDIDNERDYETMKIMFNH
ncbi:MAG: NTP transferase domain-containing protein [Deltaproteobacteria bacterium]|nr:NTP transferase domain-containing protein [Deltaproteobacteria bacterium]